MGIVGVLRASFLAVKNVEQPISALVCGTSPQSRLYPASTIFRARGTSRWSRPDLPRSRCTLVPNELGLKFSGVDGIALIATGAVGSHGRSRWRRGP